MNPVVVKPDQTLEEAFPECDPMGEPLGNKVLVQLRSPKVRSGSIVLVQETRDTERFNCAVGKVIKAGPLAYRDRKTMEPWPEGVWVKPGDFVRIPKWGGDRFEFPLDEKGEAVARFAIYNDGEAYFKITGDPLQFRDYV